MVRPSGRLASVVEESSSGEERRSGVVVELTVEEDTRPPPPTEDFNAMQSAAWAAIERREWKRRVSQREWRPSQLVTSLVASTLVASAAQGGNERGSRRGSVRAPLFKASVPRLSLTCRTRRVPPRHTAHR